MRAAPGKPDVFARIEQDLARGDLGSAHRRLASYVKSKPYDPELLARLGDLALRMGDHVVAGRELFLSSATGERVDAAIGAFTRAHGPNPLALATRLRRIPRNAELPQVVRERLERYQIEVWHPPRDVVLHTRAKASDRLMLFGCALAFLFVVGCVVAEVARFVLWLRR